MSKTVDERVVEMRFDNSKFESNVQQSMSTLDKLKQSLNLTGSAKGLENINTAAKNVDMNTLAGGVETVRARFSALEVMAVTALANITNSAVNAGKRLVSELTIAPVKSGFQEYELQIESVQTIMANTGEDVKTVNAALDELNEYADLTIYNFADMTKNAGMFTAALGKGSLDKTMISLKGIGNWAAYAGAGTADMSRATYQLGQALSSGSIKLKDWMSIENSAGMAGQNFQEKFKETAREFGYDVDSMIEANGSFRESLKEGWLTTEVFMATMEKFANDDAMTDAATKVKTFSQLIDTTKEALGTGWATTWRILVGDFEQAKTLFTEISEGLNKIIGNAADARNSLLEGALTSKWEQLTKQINDAGVSTEDFEVKLIETAREHGVAIDEMIEKEGSLAAVISKGGISKNIIIDTLKKFAGAEKEVSTTTDEVTGKLEEFQKVVNQVIKGNFGNGQDRIEALTKAGYDNVAVQSLVNKVWERNGKTWDDTTITAEDLTEVIGDLSTSELESIGFTEEQAASLKELAKQAEETGTPINELIENLSKPSGRELLIDSFRNALSGLSKIIGAVKEAWRDIFTPLQSSQLYSAIEAVHKFSQKLAEAGPVADRVKRIFSGLFAALDLLRSVLGGALSIGFKVLSEVLDRFGLDILEVAAKIGDAVVAFRNWIKEHDLLGKALDFIVPLLKEAASAVYDWVKSNEHLQSAYKAITSFLTGSLDKLKEWINGFKEAESIPQYIISGLVNGLKDGASAVISAIVELAKGLVDAIKSFLGIHSPSTKFIEIGKNIIDGLIEGIQNGLSSVMKVMKKVGEGLISAFKKVDIGKVLAVVVGVGLFIVIYKMMNAIEQLANAATAVTKPLEGFSNMLNGIGDAFKGLGQSLAARKWEKYSKALLNLAISIGVLSASVYVLSKIKSADLWESIGAIAALTVVLIGLAKISSLMKDVTNIGPKTALYFVAMGTSLLLMSKAVANLGEIGTSGLKQGIVAVGLLSVFMAGLIAVTKFAGANATKAGAMLLLVAGSLLIFSTVIKRISSLDTGSLVKGITVIGFLSLFIAGLIAVSNFAGKYAVKAGVMLLLISGVLFILTSLIKKISELKSDELKNGLKTIEELGVFIAGLIAVSHFAGKNALKAGVMLLAVSSAILILTVAIKRISGLKADEITKGISAIKLFGVFVVALIAITLFAGDNAGKAGVMILSISAAMVLLTVAIKMISKLDSDGIKQGIIAVGLLSVFVAGLIAVSHFAGDNAMKAGVMLLAVAGAMVVLTGVLFILSKIDPSGLKQGIIAVGLLSVFMAGLIAVTKLAKNCKTTLIILTVSITLLAAALVALSLIDSSSVISAAGSLAVVMGMFTLLVYMTSKAKKATSTLLILAGVVALLGGVLYLLAGLPVESTIASAVSLSVLLLALTAALLIVGKAKGMSTRSMVSIGIMTVVIGALGGVLYLLKGLPIESTISTAISLGVLLLALSAAMLILNGVGAGAIAGSAAMVVMSVGLIAIAGALYLLKDVPWDSIVNGIIAFAAVVAVLAVAAVVFNTFSLGAVLVAGVLLVLGVALLAGAYAFSVFSNALTVVGQALPLIGDGFTLLGSGVQNFVTSIADCSSRVGDFSSVLSTVGGSIFTCLVQVGDGASIMGAGLVVGAAGMIAVSVGAIALSIGIIALCAAVALGLQLIVGTVLDLEERASEAGTNVVDGFANGILGALGSVLEAGAGLVTSIIGTICGLLGINSPSKVLQEIGKYVSEGFANGITDGNSDVESAGTGLVESLLNAISGNEELDSSMKEEGKEASDNFNSGTVEGIDLGGLESMLNGSGIDLSQFESMLSGEGTEAGSGLSEGILEGVDLGSLETMLNGSGIDLSQFESMLSGEGTEAGSGLSEGIIQGIDMTNVSSTINSQSIDTSQLQSTLNSQGIEAGKSFGYGLNTGLGSVSTSSYVSRIVSSIRSWSGSFRNAGITVSKSFSDGIKHGNTVAVAATTTVLKRLITTIRSRDSEFMQKGIELMTQFATGIRRSGTTVNATLATMLASAVISIQTYYLSFYSAGVFLGSGLVIGINSQKTAAYNAGYALGQAAAQGEKDGQKSGSPSKLTIQAGKWLGEGLIIGINKMSSKVYNAGYDLGDSAAASMSSAIAKVSDVIDSDMDAQPTIRPVIDMSAINTSDMQIGTNISAALIGPVDTLSKLISDAKSDIKESNREVITAINELRSDLNMLYSSDNQEIALYVDSRKLTSALVNPMNKRLSVIANREGGL